MPDSNEQNIAPVAAPAPAPETQLVDAAVTAATPLVEEAAVDLRSKLVAEGHALIDRHLGLAKRIADLQPAVRPLLPLISACLHDLFNHLTQDVDHPTLPARVEGMLTPSRTPAINTTLPGGIDHAATAAIVDPAPEVKPKT